MSRMIVRIGRLELWTNWVWMPGLDIWGERHYGFVTIG